MAFSELLSKHALWCRDICHAQNGRIPVISSLIVKAPQEEKMPHIFESFAHKNDKFPAYLHFLPFLVTSKSHGLWAKLQSVAQNIFP